MMPSDPGYSVSIRADGGVVVRGADRWRAVFDGRAARHFAQVLRRADPRLAADLAEAADQARRAAEARDDRILDDRSYIRMGGPSDAQ